MVPSIVAETAFSRHLENEFKYDFRYGGINLHRQKDSGNKYQDLGIAPLMHLSVALNAPSALVSRISNCISQL